MKNDVLNVGIVGCGEIAQIVHIPILLEMNNFKLVALCDISSQVLQKLGEKYSINSLYTDLDDFLLQKDIDVVLVANRDHAPVAIAAMNAGKHVLIEKPMAFNLNDADEIIENAKKNNVMVMVGFMKRYDPAFKYVIEQIRTIERPQYISVHDFAGDFSINRETFDLIYGTDTDQEVRLLSIQLENKKMSIAVGESHLEYLDAYSNLLYLLSHDINLLNSTFGIPDQVLYSEVYNNNSIISVLKYGDNLRCTVEGGLYLHRREWDESFTIYGANRRIKVNFPYPYAKNVPTTIKINEQEDKINVEKKLLVSYDEAFKEEWLHFYECIKFHKEPITNATQSRKELELMINIIKAIKV